MMAGEENRQLEPSLEELRRHNELLRSELEWARSESAMAWMLFVEISRRLQVSTASIKAAVSSLLNHDLFWDPANQHEFLETIDASVDRVSRLVRLLALAFRAEAGSLELKHELHSLHEILAVVQENMVVKDSNLTLWFSLPTDGKPILVDYEYLTNALGYLVEFLTAGPSAARLQIRASENAKDWFLDIEGIEETNLDLVQTLQYRKTDQAVFARYPLQPDLILGLQVACDIFHLQQIDLAKVASSLGEPVLRLTVPAGENTPAQL